MVRAFHRSLLAALGLAVALAGCVPASVFEKLPSDMGGLPAGTPEPPAKPYAYPAVHDMPPPRAAAPMTEEQQVKLEKELDEVRDRQKAGDEPAKKTVQTPKKKQPATAKKGQPAGAQDGAKTNP